MSNGCGCERGLFRWVKPPYAETFRAACELHDDYYEWGYLSRKKCDEVLFMNMVRKVNETEAKPMRVWWFVNIAMLYYVSVRLFGWMYFKKK